MSRLGSRARAASPIAIASALAIGTGGCAHHRPDNFDEVAVTTTAPLAQCQVLGSAKGHGTELEASRAEREAEDDLRDSAAAMGGNYVVIIARDERPVDMQVRVHDVRLRGRVYHCPQGGMQGAAAPAGAGANTTWLVPAAAPVHEDGGAPSEAGRQDGGAATGAARCPAGSEPRASDSPDEPGYECGVREGDRFIAQGPYMRFWPDGAVKTEGAFDHGKRSGTWKTFDANGQLREERTYRDGQLDGPSRTWDGSGVLTEERVYRAGTVVDAGAH